MFDRKEYMKTYMKEYMKKRYHFKACSLSSLKEEETENESISKPKNKYYNKSVLIVCECGRKIYEGHYNKHLTSKYHVKALEHKSSTQNVIQNTNDYRQN